VFDLDEAVEWVAANLPFEVAAQLSHDDVRSMLTWSLEHLVTLSASGNGHGPGVGLPAVVATGETVDHVLARAQASGLECTAPQVHAVVRAELAYLQAIGAMGRPRPVTSVGQNTRDDRRRPRYPLPHQREEVVQLSDMHRTLEVVGR
jgi:hypothetical protein